MRIPAVAIAAAFSGGILLGRGLHLTRSVLETSFSGIFFLLTAALLLAWPEKLWPAAFFSLLGWVCLGALGMVMTSRLLPAEHVLSWIAAGRLN